MEITAILELLKAVPEGVSAIIVMLVLLASLFFKRKDVDFTQVTSFSKLQSEQLTILIEQNASLAKELHEVRKELSEAYRIIDDMRIRMTDLENMLREAKEVADNELRSVNILTNTGGI